MKRTFAGSPRIVALAGEMRAGCIFLLSLGRLAALARPTVDDRRIRFSDGGADPKRMALIKP
jgi:hypothetical protein